MAEVVDYWFAEGANAFKAGIPMSELMRHFPEREMSLGEWNALEQGWVAQQTKTLEQSGQARLF